MKKSRESFKELSICEQSVLLLLYAMKIGKIGSGGLSENEIFKGVNKMGTAEMTKKEMDTLRRKITSGGKKVCRKYIDGLGNFLDN